MQFSMSEDGLRADIDVDYRSSRSPQALFNGHLTASNSDVRAGDNPTLHNGRWQGLVLWWQDVFGKLKDVDCRRRPTSGPRSARRRRRRHCRPIARSMPHPIAIEDAAQEFLTDWLVRRQYDQALAMLSSRSYACLTLKSDTRRRAARRRRLAPGAACGSMEYSSQKLVAMRTSRARSWRSRRAIRSRPVLDHPSAANSWSASCPRPKPGSTCAMPRRRRPRPALEYFARRLHLPHRRGRHARAAVDPRGGRLEDRFVPAADAVKRETLSSRVRGAYNPRCNPPCPSHLSTGGGPRE